ncbi:MarR family winged helix-turn-helix transcriptional regulator [Algisphaera agarilytica]|uniref:DNA-binding MarR family transcriptional regulator n=1 Tax=Algisphaera agarilytica TaxID=1385975 RepID=A0A7X0H977_9BACT|nr:MarR family winged helix-turn-helix transcriptional regulator [Algisphaera agarilytica]MBB6430165.1 DNA-binding MarR family transcriptional regulator [Algisphaera agarilytica]
MTPPSLQHELKKQQPFDCPAEEAYLNLARTAGALCGEFNQLFKANCLSESTYNVLRILRGAQKVEGLPGLPSLEVAERLVTRVPDITRLVDRLIQAGLARRTRDDADRRVVIVSITSEGLALLRKLDKPIRQLHEKQLGHLSCKELTELNRLLEKARQPMADADDC